MKNETVENLMSTDWKKPELEEIPLSSEITSYSNAELPPDHPDAPIL
jgi:coenzyme PQQ precursor peptide PqqA